MSATLVISTVTGVLDKNPERVETTWDAIIKACAKPIPRGKLNLEDYLNAEKSIHDSQKDGKGLIPGEFTKPGTRSKADLKNRCFLVLDLDDGFYTFEQLEKALQGFECIVHSSYSHSEGKGKFRVFILFDAPIIEDIEGTCSRMLDYIVSMLGKHIDDKCWTVSQLYFTPSCPPDAVPLYRSQHIPGAPLRVADFQAPAPDPEKIKVERETTGTLPGDDYNRRGSWRQLLEGEGHRHYFDGKGCSYWTRRGKSKGISFAIFTDSNILYCHTSATEAFPFEAGKAYSLFYAYALINFGGDFMAAAGQLSRDGYGRRSGSKSGTAEPSPDTTDDWPEPSPLPEGLPPVKSLEPAMIPAPLRGWLMDIADRMQIPPDFSTAAAVVSLGSIIGRACGIHPKRHDDWLSIPNLWGGVIGRPSLMKTPAITEAQRHLVRLETEARSEYLNAAQAQGIEAEIEKITRAAILEEIKRAVRKSESAKIDQARAELQNMDNGEAAATRRRYQTQDGTTEKIGELLIENPRGLLINRDELVGWFHTLDKPGREGDRAFYLEAWNGTRGYTYDRIGRGTLDIDALCVSIFGAITPGPLSDYVYQASRGGNGDDGLLQRFQVMVWPNTPNDWRNIDRFPDTTEKNRAWEIYMALSEEIPGAVKEDGADIPALRFTPAGQDIFDTWRHELETRLRSDHGLPASLESHLAKYRSLMPSLALIFHLVEVVDGTTAAGPVSERAALMAAAWCDYLESHAGRVYGGAMMPRMESAREIVKHIRRGVIQNGATVREIWRPQWSRLTTPEEVKVGLGVLTEYDWLSVEKIITGGRPSEIIRLNPRIKV